MSSTEYRDVQVSTEMSRYRVVQVPRCLGFVRNPHMLGWRPQPCVSSLQLDVGCPVVIAAAIPDAMLLPADECFAQEVPEHVYDGLTCPKYAQWDSNRTMAVQGTEVTASLWR
jgi:hypothetical protein